MTATIIGLIPLARAIGPTGFALLTWGAILLVLIVFGYVVWALLTDRQRN